MNSLFNLNRYTTVSVNDSLSLECPLGTLFRCYDEPGGGASTKASSMHAADGSRITVWTTDCMHCEELLVPSMPSAGLPKELSLAGVVLRVRAIRANVKFRATIRWGDDYKWNESFAENGEGLSAKTWANREWRVTVGTEDSEYLEARARASRWMPSRLASYFDAVDATAADDTAIWTDVPALMCDEQIQLHFLVAWSPVDLQSATWFAVDGKAGAILVAGGCE